MTTNYTPGRERHAWGTLIAGLIALTALAAAMVLAISLAPASAETPAERCKRETSAYNNAWKNSWAASHPGKKPSDAPPPPVPYKCGGNNDGPPPTVQPTTTTPDASRETVEPSTETPSDGTGPNMNAPTERRDLEHPDSGQRTIGGRTTPSTSARTDSPVPTAPSTTDLPAQASEAPTTAPYSRSSTSDDRSDPFKKNVSDEGNNDTSDSACVRIWGTETRIGSNCHHYREEDRKVSTRDYIDFNDIAGTCTYDENSAPCGLSHTATRGVTVGFTGGFEAEFVKAELSMSVEESISVQVTCGPPLKPETSKGTIAFVTYYEPTYTIDKYYVSGGGLAERSDEQQGKQGKGVHCQTIARTAS